MIPKWGKSNAHFIYLDIDSTISLIYADDIYEDTIEDVRKCFSTSNYLRL